MPEIAVQNWNKQTVRTIELDPAVFDYALKPHLIWEAVQAYQAAGRRGTHKTKRRHEVSGGTKKLWRQKGTGRARMGDSRSPLWRHGGTVHGPQPRDYSWRFPKRMRRNALRSALAQKLREGKLVCMENLSLESHRTAALEQAVGSVLGIAGNTLFLSMADERNLELAARNNPRFKVVRALGVSIVDVVGHDTVVVAEDALKQLSEVLGR